MISDSISSLITRAALMEEEIADMEFVLAARKADLARVMEEDIPAVLHEHGLVKVDLDDGRTVSIEQMISVSQTDKLAFAKWLDSVGMGGIVKTNLDFGKSAAIDEVEDFLMTHGIEYSKATEVHPQTAKKAMREWIEAGNVPPPDSIAKVSIFEKAKIKGGKE